MHKRKKSEKKIRRFWVKEPRLSEKTQPKNATSIAVGVLNEAIASTAVAMV